MATKKFRFSEALPPKLDPAFAPKHAEPLPASGKPFKLITCGKCREKKLPFYFAPLESAYSSKCLNCGVIALFKKDDRPVGELMLGKHDRKGFHHNPLLKPRRFGRVLDATKYYEEARDKNDLGRRRWWRK